MKTIYWLVFQVWLWFGVKILRWPYISIYCPDDENVTAVTFSYDEKYIDKIQKKIK